MPRKAIFPPKPHKYRNQTRVRWKGQDFYLGPWGSPEAEAEYRKLLLRLADSEKDRESLPGLTVTDIAEAYLTEKEPIHTPKEFRNYVVTVKPLVRLFGTLSVDIFKAKQLAQVRDAMATGEWMNEEEKADYQKRGLNTTLCLNVINRRLIRIRTVWRWAESEEMVPPGSTDQLKTVKAIRPSVPIRKTDDPTPSKLEDVLKVAQHCPDAVATMVELQWWSGMRSEEVRLMRTQDIEFGEMWRYRPHKHKNQWRDQDRLIILGPECQRLLKPWLRDDDQYLFQPVKWRVHPHYTEETYSRAVARACNAAGVKVTPYQGRHAAKNRIAAQVSREAAQHALGHKSPVMTDHYGGFDLELAERAMREAG